MELWGECMDSGGGVVLRSDGVVARMVVVVMGQQDVACVRGRLR